MKINRTHIFVLIMVALLLSPFVRDVKSQVLGSDEMIINGIVMKNIALGQEEEETVTFVENDQYQLVFESVPNEFWIHVLGFPYAEARKLGEKGLIETLGISRNESCYLNIFVNAPFASHPDITEQHYSLEYCKTPRVLDINEDNIVNGLDYSQCIADAEVGEADDLLCDFNINRKVDALDLSRVIGFIGQEVPALPY